MAENNHDADSHEHVDLLVIGWGKGGKTLAGTMARAGKRVAVVEQSDAMIGGSCINIACIPTKILVHDAENKRDDDDTDEYFAKAVKRRDTLTGAMRKKNFSMLDDLDSVLLVSGRAEFTGEREVLVTGGDDTMQITADTVVVNTGSLANIPPIDGATLGGRIYDSEALQHVSPFPKRLVVVGGGYIGLEFASMFTHFGSQVTVLDRGERPLANEDADVAEVVAQALADDGVTIINEASVTAVADGTDQATVTYEVGGEEKQVDAEAVLLAVGRAPTTEGLGLGKAGIETDKRGFITVDEHLRTSAEGVFAVGDVNGGPMFTYISLDDNRILADQLLGDGKRTTADRSAVPYTMFLTPPVARVGLSEAAAREQGYDVKVGAKAMADIAAAPRAKIEGDPRGIVKFVVDGATDHILGAALVHVHSQEVINTVALAMRHNVTATELRDTIYTHPSATEALNEVLGVVK
ncbi:MAG: FAD-dependent oxidoreductase [Brevibacterium aurantiacum]|uniref:Pyridine nucleotide-disulfide oxidoreductase n=1 Tax=Brevibacterium aurantiacum TaxID=273384 RepID=A0A2H1JSV7_BREAU|nr:FAD-dependent oxidoreductase [Brevibacterium aurantiacum]AZL11596.1 pyridine nucleotide-disulfide oxidoreductase [Brevibacterium aurantiacum]AZT95776.1 pyridine nucleotide-disulfide oxidoreductase [Brevibacterium aurantiacum]MDN5660092.1 FAD-dependent oxidoreductase [Brevibacterium aurantiacum]RCS97738.1 pyridine nucleotide-disulfide oxidoreductase [Brevibacterium aurantiacum]SMX90531.1 Pyruvate/2-oxoglutarate dehydrogenase complex, dihydrolipoamide dehydrogenase (E3) component [Brevibacter